MRKKVWLDVGHGLGNRTPGIFDPGATWFGSILGRISRWYWEHTLANGLVARVVRRLQASGVEVFVTKSGNYTKRAGLAHAQGCAFGVSTHFNAPGTATGFESFVHPQAGATSKELQRQLHGRLVRATTLRDRGMKQYGFAVLAGKIPACLLEIVFMGPKDLAVYETRVKQVEDAMVDGILQRFGMSEVKPVPKVVPIRYVKFSIHAREDDVAALTNVAKDMGKAAYVEDSLPDAWKTWSGRKVN